jgi:long-chain acyl-CoA synthetase
MRRHRHAARDEYGEEIKAFIGLKQGATVKENEIVGWAKERMATYKYPRLEAFS